MKRLFIYLFVYCLPFASFAQPLVQYKICKTKYGTLGYKSYSYTYDGKTVRDSSCILIDVKEVFVDGRWVEVYDFKELCDNGRKISLLFPDGTEEFITSRGRAAPFDTVECAFGAIPLRGNVRVVSQDEKADFRVDRYVSKHEADFWINAVEDEPNKCGEWRFVDSGEDFTVEFVVSKVTTPDVKIVFSNFPQERDR